jgi:hypothetical protein
MTTHDHLAEVAPVNASAERIHTAKTHTGSSARIDSSSE